MINNKLHCYQLKMQHRMRPDIADLVVGTIYEELLNHDSVKRYPDVKGITKNVFFLTHMEKESAETDSMSKSNSFEAKFLAGFCRYLKLQGYESSQITVLTMYTGQMFLLKKEIGNTKTCQGVRITCVDNFQGEENDIILLSLVRSNAEGKIGFLNIDNRICVSLSRARHGLYVIGNMEVMAEKSKTWRAIKEKLERQDAVGDALELECQIHGTRTRVSSSQDFSKVPEGGCELICDATLSCTHKCRRVCHAVDREHKLYRCPLPCLKMCDNELHPCKGKCCDRCPPCHIKIEKTLNCELQHKMILPCHRSVELIQCSEPVEKVLPCGHKEVLACHVKAKDYTCHVEVEKQLPCSHKKMLECHVNPATIRCKVIVPKSLQPNCEHTQEVECWVLPEAVSCSSMVSKKFACGHEMQVRCSDRNNPVYCKNKCTTRLDCGHQCTKLCHVEDDPDHKLYVCRKDCSRECADGHKCQVRHHCYKQPCPPCKSVVKRTLPCGHQKELECWVDVNNYECLEACERFLPEPNCRHKCQNLCFQPCGPCQIEVRKRAPCGHGQTVLCSESATKEKCLELVPPISVPACGHREGPVPCKYDRAPADEVVKHCRKRCVQEFNPAMGGCGHKCGGNCSSCFQGRIHMKCQEQCGRQLVCGHVCEVPCSASCPPCKKRCMMKCEHSECTKSCGEPCSNCKEKCNWSCSHKACTKQCGEMCDREPCNEPCPKKLKCGHDCVGFCGEPCPPLCRVCNKTELTEFFLLGNEEDENARFVYLEDCQHTIEVEGLEGWLTTSAEGQISAKRCPRCKTTIRNCRRFGNLIRQHYKDIVTVKMRSFGNRANSQRMQNKLIGMITGDSAEMERLFVMLHAQIQNFLMEEISRNGRRVTIPKTIDEFAMRSMEFIAECAYKAAKDLTGLKSRAELNSPQYEKVLSLYRRTLACMMERQPLSRQEIIDFDEELDRLDYYKQLMIRRSLPNCTSGNVRAYHVYQRAKELVTSTLPFTSERKETFKLKLKELDEALKSGLGITDRERIQILQAMGMAQGHWYKCPNGHIYVIADCGGAMEESRCNECGARIGGGNHQLRRDNDIASEMDGATRPAWPTNLRR